MIEKTGDIWTSGADWICITTNGFVKKDGRAVMGRGIALQATKKMPFVAALLGKKIHENGNIVQSIGTSYGDYHTGFSHMVSFPTKNDWHEDSKMELIKKSCHQLRSMFNEIPPVGQRGMRIAIPRPGCGNGKLIWSNVKPVIEEILVEDNFEVWSYE